MTNNTPPLQNQEDRTDVNVRKPRNSNLELYRIMCMLMIVAHHYVVNSGLNDSGGPLLLYPESINSVFLNVFGMWGKVGINCFMMITGYYMCTSQITFKKMLKLVLQVYLYKLLIFPVFLFAGYETITFEKILKLIMPVWGFTNNFTSCFIVFYLTIPFLTILVKNMTKRQHQILLILLLFCYTILGSVPRFDVSFNYITWFGVIFLLASYIRLYPTQLFERRVLWKWMTLATALFAMGSVVIMEHMFGKGYFFVVDSNKFFAVLFAVCSFLWFKNIRMNHSKIINAFGASTFGVLLIHANSDAMRRWLWKDTVDCIGHYDLPIGQLVIYSVVVVFAVFIICNLIDQIRILLMEKPFFRWYDKHHGERMQRLFGFE